MSDVKAQKLIKKLDKLIYSKGYEEGTLDLHEECPELDGPLSVEEAVVLLEWSYKIQDEALGLRPTPKRRRR